MPDGSNDGASFSTDFDFSFFKEWWDLERDFFFYFFYLWSFLWLGFPGRDDLC
jgi:hypothetical protein